MPKIIVPIVGESDEALLEEIEQVKKLSPDMIEWRADKYTDIKDIGVVRNMLRQLENRLAGIPLLFTFRTISEGGDTEIDEKKYFYLIQAVIESKNIDLVDVEYTFTEEKRNILVKKAKEYGVFVVMSRHHFQSTPSEETIISTMSSMIVTGADIPKIAVMPKTIEDVFILLKATNALKMKYSQQPMITMAMGKYGLISRIAGEVFGSDATFGAGMAASAPGQIAVSELRAVLKIIHYNS
ncbi:type I 3-dehydroquinate dehydratase [Virgibacillus oceani]